jgi:hypothetical protein
MHTLPLTADPRRYGIVTVEGPQQAFLAVLKLERARFWVCPVPRLRSRHTGRALPFKSALLDLPSPLEREKEGEAVACGLSSAIAHTAPAPGQSLPGRYP